jgi:hypothetical protein
MDCGYPRVPHAYPHTWKARRHRDTLTMQLYKCTQRRADAALALRNRDPTQPTVDSQDDGGLAIHGSTPARIIHFADNHQTSGVSRVAQALSSVPQGTRCRPRT